MTVKDCNARAWNDLLVAVSRSFSLSLRVLPPAVRPQLGLAYLLARATDTIADTLVVPTEERLAQLELLAARIEGSHGEPIDLSGLARQNESPGERILLERFESLIERLVATPRRDRQRIRSVLRTIVSGQRLDLERFGQASASSIVSLDTREELDDYTYRVAGCVGEFWSRLCRDHVFPHAQIDDNLLVERGIRFGKGLQLINIIRDLPEDLRLGRCYVPREILEPRELEPEQLLDAGSWHRFDAVKRELVTAARDHLVAGWSYTTSLPRRSLRLRLACAWPNLIGAATLELLETRNVLDSTRRIKIQRSQLRSLMLQSILLAPITPVWRTLGPR